MDIDGDENAKLDLSNIDSMESVVKTEAGRSSWSWSSINGWNMEYFPPVLQLFMGSMG